MQERIRVDVERTGGFGGLTTRRSADTQSLPPDDARQLAEMVHGLDLDTLEKAASPARTVPDAFAYDILISTPARSTRLQVRDPDVPAELRPLIRFVVQRT